MAEPIRKPTMMGHFRRLVLIFAPVPPALLLPLAVMFGGQLSAPGWTILLSGSASVTSLLLCALVQPPPLPEGLTPEASVRRSLYRFRQVTRVRIALPLAAVAVGAAAAVIGGGLLPFLTALVLGWPQLLLALPTYHTVHRARRNMEQHGGRAYLWAGLGTPAPSIAPPPAKAAPARSSGADRGGAQPRPQDSEDIETAESASAEDAAESGSSARGTLQRSSASSAGSMVGSTWRPLLQRRPTGGPTRPGRTSRRRPKVQG